ncbi:MULTISPECIES: CAAD domain-containing protein [unclassified Nodularia (in: cyanobacteria)]|uniref:CAAD domain-containing protein n=1 Tax=unclassified Nodularia (in: cyanobacteria) TaxID=2656917 RepID=UPI00188079A4|nr:MULTISPECIES: CAAD domain-containing protein [unclassified Nodularia (in: cyanobacteria)]MBE9199192.1 CAAD domain-containing protein [Nodularia sp. LEGE 06071]MCC2695662.1 CAAD domain-containing protein [Nodularia sp. LEGE 04288]
METEQKQLEAFDAIDNAIAPGRMLPSSGGETANLPQLPPAYEPEAQWRRVARKTNHFLAQLPEYISSFFQKNQRSLLNVALILTAIITLKVVIAILAAINGVPLLSPTFELIGIGYFTWFSLRYLTKSETRQELTEKIRLFKQEIVGE